MPQSLTVPEVLQRLDRGERLTPVEVAVLRDALDPWAFLRSMSEAATRGIWRVESDFPGLVFTDAHEGPILAARGPSSRAVPNASLVAAAVNRLRGELT